MNPQPNRLPAAVSGGFAASEIDRNKPLSFRLNGLQLDGFAGDTVLSAALASGVTEAGTRGRSMLALDERFAPPVIAAERRHQHELALPMDRMPAAEGLDLVTLGARRPTVRNGGVLDRARHLLYGPRRTLAHRFDGHSGLDGPWLDAAPEEAIEADLVVVGGGVAGLGAAVAAAKGGERVVVIEGRPFLGGDASFFGVDEGEEPPHVVLARLVGRLRGLPNIKILTRTLALSAGGGEVRAHQVVVTDGVASNRHLRVRASRVVLAQGAAERLPVFPGNRTPGVGGAVAAFQRAERFGVWVGRKALFSTVSSQIYRLAIRAGEAGILVQRIIDARHSPQSRFVDFSKALGIHLAFGLGSHAIEPAGRGLSGFYAHFSVTLDGRVHDQPIWTEQLIVSGGWQPILDLWLTAGGRAEWSAAAAGLIAAGELPNVALAGAAAGYRGTSACAASGAAAVEKLFGRTAADVVERPLDPAFESPDGVLSPVQPRPGLLSRPAYLDGGTSLAGLPGHRPLSRFARALGLATAPRSLHDHPRALSVADVASAVHIGAVSPEEAGGVAAERCLPPTAINSEAPPAKVPTASLSLPYPPYLEGRFGPKPARWMIEPIEPRTLETGCLIYLNAEVDDPTAAIGVIIAPTVEGARGALALLGPVRVATGDRFVVRDISGGVAVQIAERMDGSPV